MPRVLYRTKLNNHHETKSGRVIAGGMEVNPFMGELLVAPLSSKGTRAANCVIAIPVDQLDEVLMAMRAAAASIPGSGYDDTRDLPGEWDGATE